MSVIIKPNGTMCQHTWPWEISGTSTIGYFTAVVRDVVAVLGESDYTDEYRVTITSPYGRGVVDPACSRDPQPATWADLDQPVVWRVGCHPDEDITAQILPHIPGAHDSYRAFGDLDCEEWQ